MTGVVVGNPVADEVFRDGKRVRRACGGTATYATLALKALGLDAVLIGAAAPDHADLLREPLVQAGVDLHRFRVTAAGESTAYQLDYQGDPPVRTVRLKHRGPVLGADDIADAPEGTAFVHVGAVAGEVLPEAVPALAAWGVPLGIDLHALRRFAADGTVRLGSAAESGLDFGAFDTVKGSLDEIRAFEPGVRDVPAGLRAIARRGVRHVFATDGQNGALMLADGTLEPVPAFPVVEVDATGAGDVFMAGFLFARHALGETARNAARFGAAAASFVVEGPGASTLGDRAGVERRRAAMGRGQ